VRACFATAHEVLRFSCGMTYDLGAQLLELGIIAKAEVNHCGLV
jgi:hypothetical protein